MLGIVISMNMFGQSASTALLGECIQRREKLLSDLNENNRMDFFLNENSLLDALAAVIPETKDKATKQAYYDYAKMCFNNLFVGGDEKMAAKYRKYTK